MELTFLSLCPVCSSPLSVDGLEDHLERLHIGSVFAWLCGSCCFRGQNFDSVAAHCLRSGHEASKVRRDREREKELLEALEELQEALRKKEDVARIKEIKVELKPELSKLSPEPAKSQLDESRLMDNALDNPSSSPVTEIFSQPKPLDSRKRPKSQPTGQSPRHFQLTKAVESVSQTSLSDSISSVQETSEEVSLICPSYSVLETSELSSNIPTNTIETTEAVDSSKSPTELTCVDCQVSVSVERKPGIFWWGGIEEHVESGHLPGPHFRCGLCPSQLRSQLEARGHIKVRRF